MAENTGEVPTVHLEALEAHLTSSSTSRRLSRLEELSEQVSGRGEHVN